MERRSPEAGGPYLLSPPPSRLIQTKKREQEEHGPGKPMGIRQNLICDF